MPFYLLRKCGFCFFAFALSSCNVHTALIKSESVLIPITNKDSLIADEAVKQFIAPFKNGLDKEMSEVLIISKAVFEKAQPEGPLGNLVADIVFAKGCEGYYPDDNHPPDFCLLNNGGLRVTLPEGEVTKGKIFELMPFENEIVVVTLSGEKIAELIQYLRDVNGQPVSHLEIKGFNQPDFRALIKGTPFDINKQYKVVTSDYLASGGDKMDFFKSPIKLETTNYKIRDAIIDYITNENTKGNQLKPHAGGRITNEQ